MNKTISITNDGDSPRYVGGRMIPPGETVVFAEDEAPPEFREAAEEEMPAAEDDPLAARIALSVRQLAECLPEVSDEALDRLEALEKAKDKPRAGAIAEIVGERLRRAEAAAPGGLPPAEPVAVDGEKGE